MTVLFIIYSAVLQEAINCSVGRTCSACILNEEVEASNRVDDDWVVDDSSLVNLVQVLERVGVLWQLLLLHLGGVQKLNVKAEDAVGILA